MIKQSLFLVLLLSFTMSNAQKVIPLYDGKVPNSKAIAGLTDTTAVFPAGNKKIHFVLRVASPELTVFLPEKSKATGIAVIICPGGGYTGLAIDHEGYDIAKKLNEKGIAGFVLKYRLPNSKYVENKEIVPLQDAQRAIQLVRKNAKEWGINPNKIGIEGNSAGGHLASTAGTHYQKSLIDNPLKTSLRPDFMVLNYPVISMADSLTHLGSRDNLIGEALDASKTEQKTSEQKLSNLPVTGEKIKEYSNELQVTSDTPPTFITHAVDDDAVKVQNSLLFIAALQKNKVPVESFFYAKGGHGYAMDNPTSDVEWIDSCMNWILKLNK
ncbi:alpha/beta hydrolase [Flavobacterium maritimum]|uniref:alpha/beta hydrolase n=1 Tax=Flavobacterium maritimum TaxID=3149042 RepID=UPI0032B61D86